MVSLQARLAVAMARVVRVKRSLSGARLERTIAADRKKGPAEPCQKPSGSGFPSSKKARCMW
jgi:hypothetical protein